MSRGGVVLVVAGGVIMAAAGVIFVARNRPVPMEGAASQAHSMSSADTSQSVPIPSSSVPSTIADTVSAAATSEGVALPASSAEDKREAITGAEANAQNLILGMRGDFRRCYNRALTNNPTMKGSLRLTIKVGADGKVASTSTAGGDGLSSEVIGCIVARVQKAEFAPPEGGGATIVLPLSFTNQ